MAEVQNHSRQNGHVTAVPVPTHNCAKNASHSQKRGPSIHQIYALPAPIRTFPLPVFYPSNPISVLNVAYAWLRQILAPPPAEPAIVHQGVWDETTCSVHITDEKSMRALWEQGFYGKGSLSRSEPNWLKRELVRKGQAETHVSEILTSQRREERAQAKWERARLEQEAIRQTRLSEARLAAAAQPLATQSTESTAVPLTSPQIPPAADDAPINALEVPCLLSSELETEFEIEFETEAEPRAEAEAEAESQDNAAGTMTDSITLVLAGLEAAAADAPVGPLELLRLPNSEADRIARSVKDSITRPDASTEIAAVDAPVGPLELLRLPNSKADRFARLMTASITHHVASTKVAIVHAPVGPLELLRLPNSEADRVAKSVKDSITRPDASTKVVIVDAPVSPLELLRLPNSDIDSVPRSTTDNTNHAVIGSEAVADGESISRSSKILETHVGASEVTSTDAASDGECSVHDEVEPDASSEDGSCCDASEEQMSKQQKSVRFSPKVESTTFSPADPPSPHHAGNGRVKHPLSNGHVNGLDSVEVSALSVAQQDMSGADDSEEDEEEEEIVNLEHLQLTPEESFFLTFGLGALSVTDPGAGMVLGHQDLLRRFRQYSYFPPRVGPDEPELEPDDGFLVQYAVYHHFRSLGWVPRAGIKFGVDWLLYTRGPVFDHAEFGLIVIPSYSDPWWKARGKEGRQKTWHWLHSVVRVLSHVVKSLVLVYVDVPPRPQFEAALEEGYVEALKLYRVREVMVKRWSSNRNR
ncbi:hypothetical protein E4U21_007012 [Claviceps maximensis]|nr:hypothetical protein E4U21_007012 [Claviceps maximensis]